TTSGKEAVLRARQAIAQGDGYGVYIVDRQLPDMDGTEAVGMIRSEAGGAPVIVLTAYDLSDVEEEAKAAGVTAVCGKPLFMSELTSCLGSAADKNGGAEEPAETKAARHTERILLAEDNELNQEIAVAILSEEGFTVDVANNGQEAVDMLKNSEPGYYRVVLMDVQMPVMGGYEATRLIRSLENKELASVPILAMTANAFDEDKQEALKSGMNAHIAKPVDVNTLLKVLEEVLV
ncbi:MAG: response regulator, partial [Oscillospiraceae bacterium]|nr:response regulator [Oscillospiraceae bacterium]